MVNLEDCRPVHQVSILSFQFRHMKLLRESQADANSVMGESSPNQLSLRAVFLGSKSELEMSDTGIFH